MAKIYETKDDLKRDVLDDQSKRLRLQASHQSGNGVWLIGLSILIDSANVIGARGASALMRVGSFTAGVFGVTEVVKSWFTNRDAKRLELQREQMGPQPIVLPPDAEHHTQAEPDCIPCALKHGRIKAKSLVEHAQTTESPLRLP